MRAPLSELPDSILRRSPLFIFMVEKRVPSGRARGGGLLHLGQKEDRHLGGPRVIPVQEARAGQGTARLPFLHRPTGERG